jgi:hypothetical protein
MENHHGFIQLEASTKEAQLSHVTSRCNINRLS